MVVWLLAGGGEAEARRKNYGLWFHREFFCQGNNDAFTGIGAIWRITRCDCTL